MSRRIGLQTISLVISDYQPESLLKKVRHNTCYLAYTKTLIVVTEVDEFHAWQTASFGAHGAKGVHIGPHATLYTDSLLADMGLRSGHLELDVWRPIQFLREWFRPMYPEVYSRVEADRKARVKPASASKEVEHDPSFKAPHSAGRVVYKLLLCFILICILLIWIARYS